MGKIKRRRSTRARIFFGDKKYKQKQVRKCGGREEETEMCEENDKLLDWTHFPSHSSGLGPIHTCL
jgi:hypothetical protein